MMLIDLFMQFLAGHILKKKKQCLIQYHPNSVYLLVFLGLLSKDELIL